MDARNNLANQEVLVPVQYVWLKAHQLMQVLHGSRS
jgi:hypothetical protein